MQYHCKWNLKEFPHSYVWSNLLINLSKASIVSSLLWCIKQKKLTKLCSFVSVAWVAVQSNGHINSEKTCWNFWQKYVKTSLHVWKWCNVCQKIEQNPYLRFSYSIKRKIDIVQWPVFWYVFMHQDSFFLLYWENSYESSSSFIEAFRRTNN